MLTGKYSTMCFDFVGFGQNSIEFDSDTSFS